MKRYIAIVLAVAVAAALFLAGCNSSTNEDKSWEKVKDKGEFILGLDDSFPPMGFRDEEGNITGFDIDVATEVCNRLGVNLKLQPISWDAKEQELNTGNIDCIWNGFTITEDRKKNLLFTKPYMNNRQVFVVREDSPFTKPEDLEGAVLAVQADSSGKVALDENEDFKSKLKEVIILDDYLAAIMDLEAGGVDVILMDEIVASYQMTLGKSIRYLDQELAREEYGIGFRKNDVKLMNKVQETLEAMAKDGKLAEISEKWFGSDITTVSK